MDRKAALSIIASGILWGTISIFTKSLNALGIDSIQISVLRSLIGSVILFIFISIKSSQKLKIKLKDIWLFIGTGILSLAFFNCCYFASIEMSGASVAVVLLYTSPIFVMIMSTIFFKERINGKKILALGLTLAGCVLVSGILGGSQKLSFSAIAIGIGSGLGYGLYSIFGTFALRKYDTVTVTFYTFIFSLIGTIPFCKPSALINQILITPQALIYAALIGIFATVLPYLLYTYGLKQVQPGQAAILATVEPLVGAALGIFLYKEPASPAKIVGMALIFVSIVVLNIRSKSKKTSDIS